MSNFALTTAKVLPNRATVAGNWKSSLVMTFSTVPAVRSSFRLIRVI